MVDGEWLKCTHSATGADSSAGTWETHSTLLFGDLVPIPVSDYNCCVHMPAMIKTGTANLLRLQGYHHLWGTSHFSNAHPKTQANGCTRIYGEMFVSGVGRPGDQIPLRYYRYVRRRLLSRGKILIRLTGPHHLSTPRYPYGRSRIHQQHNGSVRECRYGRTLRSARLRALFSLRRVVDFGVRR